MIEPECSGHLLKVLILPGVALCGSQGLSEAKEGKPQGLPW